MMILSTTEPTHVRNYGQNKRGHAVDFGAVRMMNHIKCSVIVKIDWKKRMHRPQAP